MVHSLSIQHNGRQLAVAPGDELLLQLEENPTTGYSWAVNQADGPFRIERNEYAFEGGAIGSGGTRTLRVRITGSGSGTLQLAYRQPWDNNVDQRFELHVNAG